MFLHLREVRLYGHTLQSVDGVKESLHTLHKQIRIINGAVALFDDGDDKTGLRLTVVIVEGFALLFVEGQEVTDVLPI